MAAYDQFPPTIDYGRIIKPMVEAHDALGKLNGLLINIPNLDLLISPLLTKEAVLSSKIEGTQADLEDVYRYEAEGKTSEDNEQEKDVKEIINYRKAIHEAMKQLQSSPINLKLVKSTHNTLLNSVRGSKKDRGEIRNIQVYIGTPGSTIKEALYLPPAPTQLTSLLTKWESYLNNDDEEKDPLVQIGLAHYQFEAIHPFMDGNGRIGRLLIPIFLYQKKLLPYPLLYVSEYFESNRPLYYQKLRQVDQDYDWESWLEFFLQALTSQTLKTQKVALIMLSLYNNLKDQVSGFGSSYAIKLLDLIFETPMVSFVSIKKRLNTKSNQTIYNLLEKFTDNGILIESTDKKRNRIYVFRQLLDIIK